VPGINYVAVVIAAAVAFVVGAVWYTPLLFGNAYLALRGLDPTSANRRPPVGEMVGEFFRYLVIAYVLARFVARLEVGGWMEALQLGLWLWFGFQGMLILGAVLHEGMPLKLYAIHAGDALAKTLFMAVILGAWHAR
jgi:hypothetical protein